MKKLLILVSFYSSLNASDAIINAYQNYSNDCFVYPDRGSCASYQTSIKDLQEEIYNDDFRVIEIGNLISISTFKEREKSYQETGNWKTKKELIAKNAFYDAYKSAKSFYKYRISNEGAKYHGTMGRLMSYEDNMLHRKTYIHFLYMIIDNAETKYLDKLMPTIKECKISDFNLNKYLQVYAGENSQWINYKNKTINFLKLISNEVNEDEWNCFFTKKRFEELKFFSSFDSLYDVDIFSETDFTLLDDVPMYIKNEIYDGYDDVNIDIPQKFLMFKRIIY